jgi:four helix bundle protein
MGVKGELMFKVQKLIAWQKRVEMVDQSFDVADLFPRTYQSSLGDQLRRAALSDTNNLAEGTGRSTPAQQRVFYDVAKGSTYEVMSIIEVSCRQGFVASPLRNRLDIQCEKLAGMITGPIHATARSEQAPGL